MGRILFRLIRCLTIACCALSPVVAGAENVGSVGLPLTGGTNDVGASLPQANVVVRLTSATASCTGTLLTPTLVLTARHCINGSAGGFTRNVVGMGRTPSVGVGPSTNGIQIFATVKSVVLGEPINGPFQPQDPKTIPENMGNDIAVVFINPKTPVLNQAVISRLTFAGPILGGDDVNGGIYRPAPGEQFGLAGWSPTGATAANGTLTRQVALFATLGIHHYPGRPDHTTGVADGQYWLRNLTGPVTWPGDSGSPAFILHADGSREPFGVLSGTTTDGGSDIDCSNNCGIYVDISRGSPKQWLLSVVQDNTRSPDWHRFHKRQDTWFGEVDYTGACQPLHDFDCDGWYDEHDDCPYDFNPDQIEGGRCTVLSPSVAGVSSTPRGSQIFRLGGDGTVASAFFDPQNLGPSDRGGWSQWFSLGQNRFPPTFAISAVSSTPRGTQIFAPGLDNRVWSAFFDPDHRNPDPTSGGWSQWFPLGPNTFPARASVTAISSTPRGTQIFVLGSDNRVWSAFFDPQRPNPDPTSGGWSQWFALGANTFPAGTTVSAVSSTPRGTQIFALGSDNRVWSAFFDPQRPNPDPTSGGWSQWFPLGPNTFPTGSAISTVSSTPRGTQIFVLGSDNRVWSTFFDPDRPNPDPASGGWAVWFALGANTFPPGTSIGAVSSTPRGTQIFALGSDSRVWSTFFDPDRPNPDPASGGWAVWFALGPNTFPARSPISAISSTPRGTQLFTRGLDNQVWSAFFDPEHRNPDPASGGWSPWFPIP